MNTTATALSPRAPTAAGPWQLGRSPFGPLHIVLADGTRHEGVVPVRAFPIQSPEVGIAIVSQDGKEVAWVERLAELPEPAQSLIREELAGREFMPVIARIVSVSSFSTPCTWTVETDRGETRFVLRGDEDIRRLGSEGTLLIADSHSIQYLVRDQYALDAHSKRILDRFM